MTVLIRLQFGRQRDGTVGISGAEIRQTVDDFCHVLLVVTARSYALPDFQVVTKSLNIQQLRLRSIQFSIWVDKLPLVLPVQHLDPSPQRGQQLLPGSGHLVETEERRPYFTNY